MVAVQRQQEPETALKQAPALAAFYKTPRPYWLVRGTFADHEWHVELESPEIRRNARVKLRFDVPIRPGRLLTAETEWRDLLTAKIFIAEAVSGPHSWITSSTTLKSVFGALLTFVRWRNSRGLPCMAALRETWFEEFLDSLGAGGYEGLVRSEEMVRHTVAQCEAAGIAPPQARDKAGRFAFDAAARLAGFENRRQISRAATGHLADWAGRHGLVAVSAAMAPEERPRLTLSGIERYVSIWRRLGELRHALPHDPIGFSPDFGPAEVGRISRALGRPLGRTRTPEAQQICYLIDRALRWVLLYADDLKTLVARTEAAIADTPGAAPATRSKQVRAIWSSIDPMHGNRSAAESAPRIGQGRTGAVLTDIRHVLSLLLPGACAVVIAAFSARRAEELISLRDDAIEEIDGELWLNTYIAKTVRARDRIPTSAAVAKAVDVLMWLSASARAETGTRWLFQLHHPFGKEGDIRSPKLSYMIRAFAAAVDVPPCPNGEYWSFLPHQFRRFFAVLYYYRYRDRSLTALSHYLRHFDPDSTRTYVTEARQGGYLKLLDEARQGGALVRQAKQLAQARAADFEEVGLQFRAEVFKRAMTGEEKMGGWAGVRITNDLQRLMAEWQAKLEIGDFEAEAPSLDEIIVEFARPMRLEPNGQGHSYCSCRETRQDTDVAACVLEASRRGNINTSNKGPDQRFAEDLICAGCPHNVQLPENAAYWHEMATAARRSCAACPGTLLAERMAQRAQAAEDHLARFHPQVTR